MSKNAYHSAVERLSFSPDFQERTVELLKQRVNAKKRSARQASKRAALLCAVLAAALLLCGFVARETGLWDLWLQKPSADPVETVRSALEGELTKEHTLSLRIEELRIDEEAALRKKEELKGSDLAASRGWSDRYIEDHMTVVWALYEAEHDHTLTFLPDGLLEQYFFLMEDETTGQWEIWDNTGPADVIP